MFLLYYGFAINIQNEDLLRENTQSDKLSQEYLCLHK